MRKARPDEVDAALALVAAYAAGPPGQVVAALRLAADRGEIDLEELTVAVESERIEGALLAIVAPGRTAFVTPPGVLRRRREREVAVALLRYWRERAVSRGLLMVQAFVEPGDRRRQGHLEAAGFERLADLIYLERPGDLRTGEGPLPEGISWVPYDESTHPLFARVIAETYQGTLDCPRLEGLRPIGDVIAGHKAQGEFRPEWWNLLLWRGREAGCVLLNAIPERDSLDITYMGLVPAARGRGLGAALVQHAIDTTRLAGRPKLTCAVDAANHPAVKIYARFDFRPTETRRVYLAIPERPTHPQR